jgi:hypothetical protein
MRCLLACLILLPTLSMTEDMRRDGAAEPDGGAICAG